MAIEQAAYDRKTAKARDEFERIVDAAQNTLDMQRGALKTQYGDSRALLEAQMPSLVKERDRLQKELLMMQNELETLEGRYGALYADGTELHAAVAAELAARQEYYDQYQALHLVSAPPIPIMQGRICDGF